MLHQLLLAGACSSAIIALIALYVYHNQWLTQRQIDLEPIPTVNKERMWRDAGVPRWLTARNLPIVQVIAAVIGGFLGWYSINSILAIVGMALGYFAPMWVVKHYLRKHQRILNRDLKTVLRAFSTLIASGSSLIETVDMVATKYAPDSYKPIFAEMAHNMRTGGNLFAYQKAQEVVNNAMFDRFVGYLRVNTELGTDLTPLINLARTQIQTQTQIANKIQSAATQSTMTGYGIPILLGGGLLLVQLLQGSQSYWGPLFTFPGNLIEVIAYALFFAGALTVNRLVAIPPPDRMLYKERATL